MPSCETVNPERNSLIEGKVNMEEVFEPPDGGWGWLVTAGACVIMVLLYMPMGVFGIIYSDILMNKEVSSATVAWIFNLNQFTWNFSAILAAPLCSQFGYRKVAFTGGVLASSSIIMSGFATKPFHLYFCYSLMYGLSFGFIIPTCDFISTQYFKEYVGTVLGLIMASTGFSYFITPVIINLIRATYGYNGAIFIVGALMMNICACACLFHPVSWHSKGKKRGAKIKTKEEKNTKSQALPVPPIMLTSSKKSLGLEQASDLKTFAIQQNRKSRTRKLTESSSYTSFNSYMSISASIPNILLSVPESSLSVSTQMNDESILDQFALIAKTVFKNLTLIKSHRIKIISFGLALFLVVYSTGLMFIPFVIKERGYTLNDASWALALAAGSNILTRITVSILIDRINWSTRTYFMFGSMCGSVSLFALSMVNNLVLINILSCIFGVGIGACIVLISLTNIEFMGLEYLPQAYSVASLVFSFIQLTVGSLLGYLRDVTGSYDFILRTLSAISLVSFVLYSLMPCAQMSDLRRNCVQPTNKSSVKESEEA